LYSIKAGIQYRVRRRVLDVPLIFVKQISSGTIKGKEKGSWLALITQGKQDYVATN
jgi:hypothetical protein